MARAGLPVTLLSGAGAELGDVLISAPEIGALAFVGGPVQRPRGAPRRWPTRGKRHFLEQEGLNAWGVWDFSQWDAARRAPHEGLRVRQAALHRLPALRRAARAGPRVPRDVPAGACTSLRFGHPLAVDDPGDPLPELDFGPVISRRQGRRAAPTRSTRRSRGGAHPAATAARWATAGSSTGRTPSAYVAPACRAGAADAAGRCTTPSRSARSTRSSSSTPRPSCSPR